MKSTQQKVFAILSIIFNLAVILSPFVTKTVATKIGYSPSSIASIPEVITLMLGAAVWIIAVFISKKFIAIPVSITICIAGIACMLVWGDGITGSWYLSGYLFLLIIILLSLLGEKLGQQKTFYAIQMIVIALLFVNVAVNIYVAAERTFYAFFGIAWDNVYFSVVRTANSVASIFVGMWLVAQNKRSKEL